MINKNNILIIGFVIVNIISYLISDSIAYRYVSANTYGSIFVGEIFNIKSILPDILFILLMTLVLYLVLKIIKKKVFRMIVLLFAIVISIPIISLYGL